MDEPHLRDTLLSRRHNKLTASGCEQSAVMIRWKGVGDEPAEKKTARW
jgi:hypothetical protein